MSSGQIYQCAHICKNGRRCQRRTNWLSLRNGQSVPLCNQHQRLELYPPTHRMPDTTPPELLKPKEA